MSNSSREAIQALVQKAESLGPTPAAVAAAEEAVRLADSAGDEEYSFSTRELLMKVATFSGYPEKLIVAFSWCLAALDKTGRWNPDTFQGMSLLWRYKWVIGQAIGFASISREQIFNLLEDFRRRSSDAGFGPRSFLDLRYTIEHRMGNLDAANTWLEKWRLTSPDALSDCSACELNGIVSLLVDSGRYVEAVAEAAPILRGELSCAEIPHNTHAGLLKAFWQLNRRDDARRSHEVGYRLVRTNRAFVQQHGYHLAHLVRDNTLEKAAALFRKHFPWSLENRGDEDRFSFLVATRSFLRRVQAQGVATIRLGIRPGLCPATDPQVSQIDRLLPWVESELTQLAQQFDQRNGNGWFASQITEDDADQRAA